MKDPRVQGLISITRVDTTTDLRYCRVYVSALDQSDIKEVVKGLKSARAICAGSWAGPSPCATPRSCNSWLTTPLNGGVRMVSMIDRILEEDEEK